MRVDPPNHADSDIQSVDHCLQAFANVLYLMGSFTVHICTMYKKYGKEIGTKAKDAGCLCIVISFHDKMIEA